MKRWETWLLHTANLLVGVSGLLYGWMRYLLRPVDEFSIVNHPLQPCVQHVHILVAPLLVLAFGHLAYHHAYLYWRSPIREGRRSGLILVSVALPMILSGYLVQVSVDEVGRLVWVWVHGLASLAWLGFYLAHVSTHLVGRRRRENKRVKGL